MKDEQDAYGHEIRDFLDGRHTHEIVERDDGFMDLSSGPQAYFAPFDEWPSWQREAIKWVRGKTLDAGCGAGRVALHLQERGIEVLGIDSSPLAIEVCVERGVRRVKLLPIERISVFGDGEFDTIVMLGNNFGLFASVAKARRLLRTMHRITGADARLIVESNDPHATDDPAHLAYQLRNADRGRMPGQIRIRIRHRQYIGRWFDYLLVSKEEMEGVVSGTGWKVREYVDSGQGMYCAIITKDPSKRI